MKINNKDCKFKHGGRTGVNTNEHEGHLAEALNRAYKKWLRDQELDCECGCEIVSDGEVIDAEDGFEFFSDLINCKLLHDFSKVLFDCENVDYTGSEFGDPEFCGYHLLDNGFEFVGFSAGGDWEYPLYGIVYHDGKKLRGYIPEWGNVFNRDARTAFGSERDSENEKVVALYDGIPDEEIIDAYLSKYGYKTTKELNDGECVEADVDVMIQDIKARIEVV